VTRVVLRRTDTTAATLDKAERLVAASGGTALDRSSNMLLVELPATALKRLQGDLPGWLIVRERTVVRVPKRPRLEPGGVR
jgi:hypothetical protein